MKTPMNTTRTFRAYAGALATLAMLTLPLAAAQGDGEGAENQEANAGLRIAHLAPEGPNVDVMIDGELMIEDLAPNTVSKYVFLEPGDRRVEVVAVGTAGGATPPPPVDPAAEPGAAAPAVAPENQEGQQAENPPADADAAGEGAAAGEAAVAPATEDAAPPADAGMAEPLFSQTVTLEQSGYATLVLSASEMQGAGQDGQEGQQDGEGAAQEGEGEDTQNEDEAEAGAVSEQPEGDDQAAAEQQPGADAARTDPEGGTPPAARISFEGSLVQDGVDQLPGAGEAMVRVVHGALRSGNVDVVAAHRPANGEGQQEEQPEGQEGEQQDGEQAQDGQEGPAPIEGQELASGLAAGDTSEYTTVQAGTHHLQVRSEGGDVVVNLDEMLFESGLVYTVYVAATEDGQDYVITATVDAGVSSEAR